MNAYLRVLTQLTMSLTPAVLSSASPSIAPPFFCASRRRHTRWPRDSSSDVCSSDLDGRLQWEDIVELQNEYRDTAGGLSSLSGWFVQDALKWQKEVIRAISKYKTSGRSGSKHGVDRKSGV